MDLTKVASLLKEASSEIKKLKEENAQLKIQMQELQKVAGDVGPSPIANSDVFGDGQSFGFGNVSQDEYSQTSINSTEMFKQVFGIK